MRFKTDTMSLRSLKERLEAPTQIECSQRKIFFDIAQRLQLPMNSAALSVGVGGGIWDYFLLLNNSDVGNICACDIVACPVKKEDRKMLMSLRKWNFLRIMPDAPLPFPGERFDMVFHQDVIEHTKKPFLFFNAPGLKPSPLGEKL